MLINGHCQCGNIAFVLEWLPDPTVIPARACSCSFCQIHAGVWTSSPTARLKVTIRNPAQVARHSFATRTAEFHVCGQCGEVPLVTSLIDGRLFAVVNVNALQDIPPGLLQYGAADFDGESLAGRVERRRQRWIADVSMEYAS